MSAARRVVITGLGLISPLGNSKRAIGSALAERRSGVRTMTRLPVDYLPSPFAAEAWDFEGKIDEFGPLSADKKKMVRKGLKVMCRETQMGVAAAQLALDDAGLGEPYYDPDRAGVIYGSDYMMTLPEEFAAGVRRCADSSGEFEFERWAEEGMPQLTPLWLLKYLPNMPASHVAIFNDLRGPNNSITQREASFNLAVGEALCIIRRGTADMLVAGATGTRVHPMRTLHIALQEELATNGTQPHQLSRPFEANRTGMVLGEGAGAIVLEEFESAKARGATIYGEVLAHASSAVADRRMVAQCDAALTNVMQIALRSAGVAPGALGHLHAHGSATRHGDVQEARAICEVFGDSAGAPLVTAAKSFFGNLGAGGGAVELIASLLALSSGEVAPILNYESPDPQCPIHAAVEGATAAGDSFLNVNVTPQGQASAVLVRRV